MVVVVVMAAAAAVVVVVVAAVLVVVVVVVVVVVEEVKVKVIPQYTMTTQRKGRCIVLPIYNPGARRVNTMPRPDYTKETDPILIVQEVEWVSGPVLTGALFFFSFRPSFNLVFVCLLYLLAFALSL
jgi:hypothetical protein